MRILWKVISPRTLQRWTLLVLIVWLAVAVADSAGVFDAIAAFVRSGFSSGGAVPYPALLAVGG